MSQASQGLGEATDGQQSKQDRGKLQYGGSPKRVKTSLDAGRYSEQSHELPGDTFITSAGLRPFPTSPASATPASNPRVNETSNLVSAQVPPRLPLKIDSHANRRRTNSPTGDSRAGKYSPPRRPPRADHVSPITESPSGHDHPSVISAQQSPRVKMPEPLYWENDYQRTPPGRASPSNTSGASVGCSGPLAPPLNGNAMSSPRSTTPTAPPTARRPVNLGPPPSARRGAAAYYLPPTYVTPIPEESPETAHRSQGSFASSHVIPTSWGSSPPNLYVGEDPGEVEEDEYVSAGEDGKDSNGGDHDEASGLVRQASLGKRHKPALTTIKSIEMSRADGATSQGPPTTVHDPPRKADNNPKGLTTRTLDGAAGLGYAQGSRQYTEEGLSGGTGLLDRSSSSDESLVKMSNASTTDALSHSRSVSPLAAPIDPRIHRILGGLERAGALEPRGTGFAIPRSTPLINETSARLPNPPRVGLYTTGEQDSRNSLTSLPELIRRATRLASVLDRGRTASRLGMLDSEESGDGREKISSPAGRRRSGSISDILASFPSPGFATPTGERPSPRFPFTSSGLARHKFVSSLDSPSTNTHGCRRRCCGLPLWGFLLLCIIILLALAAAVVIPVTLIVIPRQHGAGSGQASSLGSCQTSQPCANGGTSVFNANSCQCLCADGYAGDRCAVITDSSCVTTNIKVNNGVVNVTVGSSLPRLLQSAQSNFSIPLDPSTLMSLFSAANLSCTSQNALVTFNGRSQRRNLLLVEAQRIEDTTSPTRASRMAARTLSPSSSSAMVSASPSAGATNPGPASNAITSNGLVFAAPTAAVAPSPSATPTSSSSTSSPNLGAGSTTGNAVDDKTLDFCRISVLYIFQLTTLNTAVIAQENIQIFLSAFSRSKFNVTGSIEIDFGRLTIDLGNGTTVGGTG